MRRLPLRGSRLSLTRGCRMKFWRVLWSQFSSCSRSSWISRCYTLLRPIPFLILGPRKLYIITKVGHGVIPRGLLLFMEEGIVIYTTAFLKFPVCPFPYLSGSGRDICQTGSMSKSAITPKIWGQNNGKRSSVSLPHSSGTCVCGRGT